MNRSKFITYSQYCEYAVEKMKHRAADFYADIRRRRTVRDFSDRPVPREIIKKCLMAANTAPSGANKQPWHFVVVNNPEVKKKIRAAAEKVESTFYRKRISDDWLKTLAPLGTNAQKPFLEIAPYLIIIFAESYALSPGGRKIKNYYVQESVSIATGILITAIHHAGLVCLPYTPSPMGFLNEILNRPANERPCLVLVVGYPAKGAKVPDIGKKSLNEVATFVE